jgi:Tfp pilus assembly protein FimT
VGRRSSGVTLLELVVVIVILGTVLALAIPILRSAAKSLAVPSARTHLVSMLKTARETALVENTPTWVSIETNSVYCGTCNRGYDVGGAAAGSDFACPACRARLKVPDRVRARMVSVLSRERVGQWHFEDLASGSDLQTTGIGEQKALVKSVARAGSTPIHVLGKIGRGIRLDGRTWIETPDIPLYHPQQGIGIGFWVNREDQSSTQAILKIGANFSLSLESRTQDVRSCPNCAKWILARDKTCGLCGAAVAGGATRQRRGTVLVAKAGSADAATIEPLPALAWSHVEVIFVAGELRIYVDDVLRAARPGAVNWGARPGPLVIGARDNGLRGTIDEVSVDLIVPRDSYTLPPELVFEPGPGARPNANAQLVLSFDREGRLDRARHSQPVQLKIKTPEGDEAGFQVELNGTVPR